MMRYKKEDLPQYRFAQTIRQVENATLLCYLYQDGGFYFASDVLPQNKYFCAYNINLPEMVSEHLSSRATPLRKIFFFSACRSDQVPV